MKDSIVRFECMECDFAVESSDQDEVITLAQMHAVVKHADKMSDYKDDNVLKNKDILKS